jgi:hypothetical protein
MGHQSTKHGRELCMATLKCSILGSTASTIILPLGTTAQGEFWPLEQLSFYGVRLLASCPTPKLEDQGIPLRLAP